MLKSTIIAIMLLMMSLTAGARQPVITHADFVHLSDAQKDEYVIKLMELAVELESRYQKDTAEYGYSKERFERYSKVLRAIQSIFIDSAYASTPAKNSDMSWNRLAQNFHTLLNTKRSTVQGKLDENCIFAGWVSRVVYMTINGKPNQPTCVHPDFVDGAGPDRHKTKMSPESLGYPYPNNHSTCGKDDRKMIQCNPVIFGYKSIRNQSLFCVEAKQDGAKNSSFECMKAALDEAPATATVDSKQTRLADLRKRLGENPKVFEQVWEFTYKTCVCPTVSESVARNGAKNKFFSQDYQNQIRPHRTCFGLMDMMGATALECTDPNAMKFPLTDTSIFADLRQRIKRETISEENADKEYSNYLQAMLADKSVEYARLCNDTPTPKTYTCTGGCKADAADATKLKCDYSINVNGQPAQLDGTPTGPEPKADVKQVDVKFKVKGSAEEKSVKCDLTFETAPVETPQTVSCTGACSMQTATVGPDDSPENAPKTLVCLYSIKQGDKEAELEGPATGPEPKADVKEVNVEYILKGTTEKKTVKCTLTFTEEQPQNTDTGKPSLETTIDDCKNNICTIKAKWDKEKYPGWSLSWDFKTPPQGETIAKGWEPTEQEKKTQAPTEDKPASPEEIKQAKGKKPYDVCAIIQKGTEKVGPECETVGALGAAPKPAVDPKKENKPVLNYDQNGQPQLPQAPIRGSSDTSAVGIK